MSPHQLGSPGTSSPPRPGAVLSARWSMGDDGESTPMENVRSLEPGSLQASGQAGSSGRSARARNRQRNSDRLIMPRCEHAPLVVAAAAADVEDVRLPEVRQARHAPSPVGTPFGTTRYAGSLNVLRARESAPEVPSFRLAALHRGRACSQSVLTFGAGTLAADRALPPNAG